MAARKRKRKPRRALSEREIREALERGARNADELEKRLRGVFRLPKSDLVLG